MCSDHSLGSPNSRRNVRAWGDRAPLTERFAASMRSGSSRLFKARAMVSSTREISGLTADADVVVPQPSECFSDLL